MTVAELLGRISSRELSEWMVYYELEPFGEERGDLRAGIVASTIANVNRDPKKQRAPYGPADFLPKFEGGEGGGGRESADAKSPEVLRRKWEMVVAAFGSREKK